MLAALHPLLAQSNDVSVDLTLHGIIALVAGIAILLRPKLLARLVAAYLIIIGLIEIFDISIDI
jgi:hypothetical protein